MRYLLSFRGLFNLYSTECSWIKNAYILVKVLSEMFGYFPYF